MSTIGIRSEIHQIVSAMRSYDSSALDYTRNDDDSFVKLRFGRIISQI